MKILTRKRVYLPIVLIGLIVFTFQYNPPVEAVDPHQLIHVTDPGVVGGLRKSVQTFFEITPCTYEILGWSNANDLYYESICFGIETSYVFQEGILKEIANSTIPTDLSKNEVPPREYRDYLVAMQVRPASYEEQARKIYTRNVGYMSPDGESIAFVTRYIYSVYDVLILDLEGA